MFWQSPRTRKQARPNVTLPTARAGGLAELEIIVDTREHYAYRFAGQAVSTVSRALPCGDYGVVAGGRLVAVVERKSVADLVTSVASGKLRYALGDLAAVPRAAVVVEDRYSALFKQRHARPAVVADTLAEYQVRWPTIPIVFCETRSLAEEWTYRYLAAAWQWAASEPAAQKRTATTDSLLHNAPAGRLQLSLKCAPGPAVPGLRFPTEAACAGRSGRPGGPPTESHGPSTSQRRTSGWSKVNR